MFISTGGNNNRATLLRQNNYLSVESGEFWWYRIKVKLHEGIIYTSHMAQYLFIRAFCIINVRRILINHDNTRRKIKILT